MARRAAVRRKPALRWASLDDVKPNPVSFDAPAPAKPKRGRSEHDYQVTQIEYLRLALPSWFIAAIVSEAKAATKNVRAALRWRQDRIDAGLVPGTPDVLALGPYPAAFLLENKSEDGGVRPEQKAVHQQLRDLGWQVHVSRSLDDLIPWLKALGHIRS